MNGLDHPIIAVSDMESARRTYERLGFTVPPRGSHIEWGTGNWCIMFERAYLELRGIAAADRYLHGLDDYLARHGEGLMGVAFAPATTAHAAGDAMREAGFLTAPLRQLTRNFELPEGIVPVRFSLSFLEPDALPGLGASLTCEHLTPEVMRRPEWLTHANGANGIRAVVAVVDDLAEFAATMARAFGAGHVVQVAPDVVAVRVSDEHSIYALTRKRAETAGFPVRRDGSHLIGVILRTNDAEGTARFMAAQGIGARRTASGVLVDADQANGAAILFADRNPEWNNGGELV